MANEFIIQLRITGPDNFSQLFLVPAGATTIGRQAGNPVRLESQLVSRQHARLDCTSTGCQIADLGSANGTVVNGERLTANVPVALAHGSVIEIGQFRLIYEQIPVAPAKPAQPPPPAEKPVEPPVEKEPASRAKQPAPSSMGTPPSRQITPPPAAIEPPKHDYSQVPPGLTMHSNRLLNYLPGIYHNDFMARFLGIFEAIITPIEWNVDNFDMYLNPGTAPDSFLPWLENWFTLSLDPSWSEAKRRTLLKEAHEIYARRGTRWALCRVLEIYTEVTPEITDIGDGIEPFNFVIRLPLAERQVDRALIERLIDANKPAHTFYKLEFAPEKKGARK